MGLRAAQLSDWRAGGSDEFVCGRVDGYEGQKRCDLGGCGEVVDWRFSRRQEICGIGETAAASDRALVPGARSTRIDHFNFIGF